MNAGVAHCVDLAGVCVVCDMSVGFCVGEGDVNGVSWVGVPGITAGAAHGTPLCASEPSKHEEKCTLFVPSGHPRPV